MHITPHAVHIVEGMILLIFGSLMVFGEVVAASDRWQKKHPRAYEKLVRDHEEQDRLEGRD